MKQPVILSAARTPVGKFGGGLKDLGATRLGAIAVRESVKRAGMDPSAVEECIMGNVISAGLGQNPARQAALYGGLPPEVSALTINKVCGSGLKAVMLASDSILAGKGKVFVAGGMENMTNAPYLLDKARFGYKLFDSKLVDAMVRDGLWDVFNDFHIFDYSFLFPGAAHYYNPPIKRGPPSSSSSWRMRSSSSAERIMYTLVRPIDIAGMITRTINTAAMTP